MKTWIFEVVGNSASVYVTGAVSGAYILYRKIKFRPKRSENLKSVHEHIADGAHDAVKAFWIQVKQE